MSDQANLREATDRLAIMDVIYRYCRAMDRMDAEIGYSIWHEDATADYGDVYQGSGRGFIDFVNAQHLNALAHTHQVTNIIIELDGDQAGSESYVSMAMRFAQGDQIKQVATWGRYVDQWSRKNGRWGIDKRIAIIDFDEVRDVTSMRASSAGRRDKTDPSYSVLKGPR